MASSQIDGLAGMMGVNNVINKLFWLIILFFWIPIVGIPSFMLILRTIMAS